MATGEELRSPGKYLVAAFRAVQVKATIEHRSERTRCA
jgi:hypothetical protein